MTEQNSNIIFQSKPNAPTFLDLEGQKFGRLTVIGFKGREKGHSHWYCRCECGSIYTAHTNGLRIGKTTSCGCWKREKLASASQTHGKTRTRIYRIWRGMKNRCQDIKSVRYAHYGGRGIKVCEEWASSFENFYADMGEPPTEQHSLDRINRDGNYLPENCRWASVEQQMNNTSQNRYITMDGKTQSLSLWCKELKVRYSTVIARIYHLKWDVEKALKTPTK